MAEFIQIEIIEDEETYDRALQELIALQQSKNPDAALEIKLRAWALKHYEDNFMPPMQVPAIPQP